MATNTTATVPPLPNPFTPLAFLPPTIADEVQAVTYLSVATLSAFTWDWLMSLTEEIKMCRKRKFTLAIAVYFLARISTFACCAMVVVVQAAPVPNCKALTNAIAISIIFAIPSTSTLFFLRVKAVYHNDKVITGIFGVLLFALFGVTFLSPFTFKGGHLGMTQRCIATHIANYVSVPAILQSIHDTLVFIAISLRIVSYSILGDTFSARMRSFVRGDGLPHLSRSVLQGGQMYYFATIGLNTAVIVMAFAPVPLIYRTMFFQPHLALDNVMACRVFRLLRLGLITDVDDGNDASTSKITTLHFPHGSHPTTVHGSEGSHNDEWCSPRYGKRWPLQPPPAIILSAPRSCNFCQVRSQKRAALLRSQVSQDIFASSYNGGTAQR